MGKQSIPVFQKMEKKQASTKARKKDCRRNQTRSHQVERNVKKQSKRTKKNQESDTSKGRLKGEKEDRGL